MRTDIYIGNEAADADSIVSSICYAYFKYLEADAVPTFPIVPVVSIPRNELHLRRDVEVLLNKVNVSLEELICIDELEKFTRGKELQIEVTLLDHNKMAGKLTNSGLLPVGKVREILDHHEDSGDHPECGGIHRNIAYSSTDKRALVASACTLVYEKFAEHRHRLDTEASLLLFGVILLDSLNMDPKAAKGTERDLTAITDLASICDVSRESLFEELRNAKINPAFWHSLCAADCLVLDYKQFSQTAKLSQSNFNFGISSVLLSVLDFATSKPDLAKAVSSYLDGEKGPVLDAFVVMNLVMEPSLQRGLMIFSRDETRIAQIHSFLTKKYCDDESNESKTIIDVVEETSIDSAAAQSFLDAGLHYKIYQQGNLKASRKQVAPLLSDFYVGLE